MGTRALYWQQQQKQGAVRWSLWLCCRPIRIPLTSGTAGQFGSQFKPFHAICHVLGIWFASPLGITSGNRWQDTQESKINGARCVDLFRSMSLICDNYHWSLLFPAYIVFVHLYDKPNIVALLKTFSLLNCFHYCSFGIVFYLFSRFFFIHL